MEIFGQRGRSQGVKGNGKSRNRGRREGSQGDDSIEEGNMERREQDRTIKM